MANMAKFVRCPKCQGEGFTSEVEGENCGMNHTYLVNRHCYFCSTTGEVSEEMALKWLQDNLAACVAAKIVEDMGYDDEFGLHAAESGMATIAYHEYLINREGDRINKNLSELPPDVCKALIQLALPELWETTMNGGEKAYKNSDVPF